MSDADSRSALICLSRRLRTVSAKELPLVDRAVLLAVAGRADNDDWIAFPPVEWAAREAGTTPNTARRALDRLINVSGWLGLEAQATDRLAARYKIRLEPVPPSGVTLRHPSKGRARGDGAAPQGLRTSTPGVTEQHPRGDGAAPADHRQIPSRSQAGTSPPAQARASLPLPQGGQQSLPLSTSPRTTTEAVTTTATTTPLPKSGKRAKTATDLPEGWGPKPAHFAKGAELGFDRDRVTSEADRFTARAAAKGEVYVDWEAAFRTWLLNQRRFEEERGIPLKPIASTIPRMGPAQPPRPADYLTAEAWAAQKVLRAADEAKAAAAKAEAKRIFEEGTPEEQEEIRLANERRKAMAAAYAAEQASKAATA